MRTAELAARASPAAVGVELSLLLAPPSLTHHVVTAPFLHFVYLLCGSFAVLSPPLFDTPFVRRLARAREKLPQCSTLGRDSRGVFDERIMRGDITGAGSRR